MKSCPHPGMADNNLNILVSHRIWERPSTAITGTRTLGRRRLSGFYYPSLSLFNIVDIAQQ
jgi:hypothetical protein